MECGNRSLHLKINAKYANRLLVIKSSVATSPIRVFDYETAHDESVGECRCAFLHFLNSITEMKEKAL